MQDSALTVFNFEACQSLRDIWLRQSTISTACVYAVPDDKTLCGTKAKTDLPWFFTLLVFYFLGPQHSLKSPCFEDVPAA